MASLESHVLSLSEPRPCGAIGLCPLQAPYTLPLLDQKIIYNHANLHLTGRQAYVAYLDLDE